MAQDDDTARTFDNALATVVEALGASELIESVEVLDTHDDTGRLWVVGVVKDSPDARFTVQLDVS